MKRFHFWIVVAILGIVLYMSPGFFVRRMYEGFADQRVDIYIHTPQPQQQKGGWMPTPKPPPIYAMEAYR